MRVVVMVVIYAWDGDRGWGEVSDSGVYVCVFV